MVLWYITFSSTSKNHTKLVIYLVGTTWYYDIFHSQAHTKTMSSWLSIYKYPITCSHSMPTRYPQYWHDWQLPLWLANPIYAYCIVILYQLIVIIQSWFHAHCILIFLVKPTFSRRESHFPWENSCCWYNSGTLWPLPCAAPELCH
jgi:hypothetical protein